MKELMKAIKHSEALVKNAHCNLRKNRYDNYPRKHLFRPDEVSTIECGEEGILLVRCGLTSAHHVILSA